MSRPRSDIAPRILRAARARFLRQGVDGASLRRIAKDARTSIGMVYYYFRTKDDLFLAVVEEVYAALLADLEVALAPDAPPPDRLRRAFHRFGRLSKTEHDVVRMVLREMLLSSQRLDRIVARFARGHLPLAVRAIADGLASGNLSSRHAPAVMVVSSFALGLFPQIVRPIIGDRLPPGFDPPTGTALADALADVLLDGLRPRS